MEFDLLDKFLKASKEKETVSDISLGMYKRDIADFKEFLGKKSYEEADKNDVAEYIKFMEKKYVENSIIRKVSSIKSFYKFLLKIGAVETSPAETINMSRKNKKTHERKIELNELKSILDCCGEDEKGKRDKIIIKLLSETGMQITEILNLKISEMEEKDYKAFIVKTGNEYIIVELSEESSKELRNYVEKYRNNIVADRENDKIFCDLSRQNFRARFIKYAEKAGLPSGILPHMIKNRCEYERHEAPYEKKDELLKKIKEEYFRIGIGDD